MKLSIYLFKEKFKKNDDIKLEKYKEVTLKSDLSFNAKLFIRKRKISEPAWFLFLKDYFDFSINDPNSTTNSLVLLIESNSRVFAVTFGYGFTAIKRSQIEKNFGLKIVLNSVDDDKLDIVDYFSINSSSVNKSKHKRIHVHGGTPTYDFEIRETSDLIKMISGKPKEKNFAKKISGADSITITVEDIAIENLQSKCNELFEKYLLKDYQKKFAFIDYILPIDIESTKKETVYLLKILEEDLKKAVLNKNHEKVSVSPPRIIEADVVKYVVRKGSIKESFDELNLTDLYLLNKKNKFENPIDELSIIEYYDEQKHSAPRKMREYILFQTQHYGKTYLHISGDWYEVETEFYKSIKDRVKKNLVSYNSLQLLALNTNEEEKDYNSRLSKKEKWLLLDRKNYVPPVRTQDRVEVSDLLTRDNEFICVKKMTSSAALSHLFSQGSVSAKLLRKYEHYQDYVKKFYKNYYHDTYNDNITPTFVYAIATEKPGDLLDNLFFFSLINLDYHIELIKDHGFKISLSKIEIL